MKYLWKKIAFTLAEMLISITILWFIFVGIFGFVTGAFTKLVYEDTKITSIEQVLDFQKQIEDFYNKWYNQVQILSYDTTNPNKALLMKNIDASKGAILVWVVHLEQNDTLWVLQSEYVYGNNFLAYTRIAEDRVQNIEQTFTTQTFPRDTIFQNLRVKHFIPTLFNEWKIVDIELQVTHLFLKNLDNRNFETINDSELYLQKYNLVF